jgi:hypothetical protein
MSTDDDFRDNQDELSMEQSFKKKKSVWTGVVE